MNESLQLYFKAGDFAKLCNVSKHTLFHYDEIGIFSPELKLENGYRYYSTNQIEAFRVISVLKELDMPLREIKKYIDNRSPSLLVELLDEQEKIIDEKINELTQMKKFLKKKSEITRLACLINHDEISLSENDEEYLAITHSHCESSERKMAIGLAEHLSFCENNMIYSPYPVGSMLSVNSIRHGHYMHYEYFFTRLENKSDYPNSHIKKAGRYLTAYHVGGYYTVLDTYKRMLNYLDNHSLTPSGWFYEDVLLDDLCVKGYEEYILKISILVE